MRVARVWLAMAGLTLCGVVHAQTVWVECTDWVAGAAPPLGTCNEGVIHAEPFAGSWPPPLTIEEGATLGVACFGLLALAWAFKLLQRVL